MLEEVFFSLGARSVDGESELPDAELELPDGEAELLEAGCVSVVASSSCLAGWSVIRESVFVIAVSEMGRRLTFTKVADVVRCNPIYNRVRMRINEPMIYPFFKS